MTRRSPRSRNNLVDDVAAMQKRVRIVHLRASSLKFLAPSTRCPISTATGFPGVEGEVRRALHGGRDEIRLVHLVHDHAHGFE